METPLQPGRNGEKTRYALLASAVILIVWTIWQCIGIEAMRMPWEDEVLYDLAPVNWAIDGNFSIPQLGHFLGADIGWRWHMPLYPLLAAGWIKLAGYQLTVLRLFGLLPAVCMAFLLAWSCVRLAAQKNWPWLLFWLGIILGDKSFVTNSLNGRMDFWCLLALIASVALVLHSGKRPQILCSGVLLGIAMGFHPFAAYFLPGILCLSVTGGLQAADETAIRWRRALYVILGFSLVAVLIAIWFLADWQLTKMQFFPQVLGTVQGSLTHNARVLLGGLAYNFRFQPFFLYAVLAVLFIHLWHILGPSRASLPDRTFSLGLVLLMAGYIVFLLHLSRPQIYYYPAVVLAGLLMMARALTILRLAGLTAHKIALVILFLLLANNLAFMAAKTRTVWRNRDVLDPAPMNACLATELKAGDRCVLPTDLWLYAKQHHLNFRVDLLTLIGQPAATYQTYLQSLLDWRPDTIVLDQGEIEHHPGSCFTADQLAAAGYVEQAHYDRMFRDRTLNYGYRLVFYHHVPGTSLKGQSGQAKPGGALQGAIVFASP
jgi:hypothetical protein